MNRIKKVKLKKLYKHKAKSCFEGWYYRITSKDGKDTFAFIPGYSKPGCNEDAHAFIQIIDGRTTYTNYTRFLPSEFTKYRNETVKISENLFSKDGISLNLTNSGMHIRGELLFEDNKGIKRTPLSPTAMGFFEYLPFMECKHDVLSMKHKIKGCLNVNGRNIDFTDGYGYIEKDLGVSFPKSYSWIQANCFKNESVSLMCSIADVPLALGTIEGFICILNINNNEYRFATYNKSNVISYVTLDDKVYIKLKNKKYIIEIKATCEDTGFLMSPKNGDMIDKIKESLTSHVKFILYDIDGNKIMSDFCDVGGVEILI